MVRTLISKICQCPNCSGTVEYNIEDKAVVCSHCGCQLSSEDLSLSIPIDKSSSEKVDTAVVEKVDDFVERAPWEMLDGKNPADRIYACPTCGAKIITDQSVTATTCPYCKNNLLLSGIATHDNIPKKLIPFEITIEQAKQAMLDSYKDKKYVDQDFELKIEHVQSIYIPYYLFSATLEGDCLCVNRKTPSEQGIRVKGKMTIDDMLFDASSKMPNEYMDAMFRSFDFSKLEEFNASFVTGHMMEVPDESFESCYQRLKDGIEKNFKEKLGKAVSKEKDGSLYSYEVRENKITLTWEREPMLCALPVWLVLFSWEGKPHLFAVNGSSGECIGQLPVNDKKYSRMMKTGVLLPLVIDVIAYFVLAWMVLNSAIPFAETIALILAFIAVIVVPIAVFINWYRMVDAVRKDTDNTMKNYERLDRYLSEMELKDVSLN